MFEKYVMNLCEYFMKHRTKDNDEYDLQRNGIFILGLVFPRNIFF